MGKRALLVVAIAVVFVLATFLRTGRGVQGQEGAVSYAAVPGLKGGQDLFGGYEAVPNWPKPLSSLPDHETWTFGAGQSVFAESANRVFYLQRGELPRISLPRGVRLQPPVPSIDFPIRRAPVRNASSASPPGALFGPDGKTPGDDSDSGKAGVDFRWHHTIVVLDAQGNYSEDWTRWDSMLRRPHFVVINPYDPEKHVWIMDDYRHALFKFTNDGQRLVQTIGVPNVPGNDERHFYRPTFVAFLPDVFFVADGYVNSRVVKFNKDGKFLLTWGQEGNLQSNRFLWAADQGTSKMLKYDLDGHFLYQWGTAGDEATGEFWGTHGVSVDPDGNFYTAEVFRGGVQKFHPRAGANPAFLVGKAQNPAWPR